MKFKIILGEPIEEIAQLKELKKKGILQKTPKN
jgi:hypothetical protein